MLLDLWPLLEETGTTGGGVVRFRAHGPLNRRALTGHGHLRVIVVLTGTPGLIPVLDGEGRFVTRHELTVEVGSTGSRGYASVPLLHGSGTARTSGHLTATMTAVRTRIIDPDEWLLLDLPELT